MSPGLDELITNHKGRDMSLLEIDPVLVQFGPFAIRWYGVLMATSVALGFYYFRRDAARLGYSEDFVYNVAFLSVLGGIIGARAVYVLTNWSDYRDALIEIIRIDHGGLSFHGGIIGGALAGGLYVARRRYSFNELADLAVPGIAIGIMLVRIANLINGEVLGRTMEIGLERQPAQLIGSAVGLALLLIHNYIARRKPPAGYLFWSFVLYYSLLRGLVEETVRANPLYAWGYVNETWGIGFFTLTQIVTPVFVLLAWWMRRQAALRGRMPAGPKAAEEARRP